jgi:hypothetical protein
MDCPNCKTYGEHGEEYHNANSSMFTVFPEPSNRMVNYPAINFSGNMGSNQIPQSSPASLSKEMTGGASKSKSKKSRRKRKNSVKNKKRCKTMKIKNVGIIYKKDTMNPRKDIRAVKKQLMRLTEISFPPLSGKRSRAAARRSRKSKASKKTKKSRRNKKRKGTRKQRGGTTSTGYSTGGIVIPASELRLANPAPHTPYPMEGHISHARSL